MAGGLRAPVAVVDASALYALVDAAEPAHEACVRALDETLDEASLVVSPFVLAEADYLVLTRLGREAEVALLRDVRRGVFRLARLNGEGIAECLEVLERYADSDVGLADASNVVLAGRVSTNRLFTLDRRHFGMMQTMDGRPFELLPES